MWLDIKDVKEEDLKLTISDYINKKVEDNSRELTTEDKRSIVRNLRGKIFAYVSDSSISIFDDFGLSDDEKFFTYGVTNVCLKDGSIRAKYSKFDGIDTTPITEEKGVFEVVNKEKVQSILASFHYSVYSKLAMSAQKYSSPGLSKENICQCIFNRVFVEDSAIDTATIEQVLNHISEKNLYSLKHNETIKGKWLMKHEEFSSKAYFFRVNEITSFPLRNQFSTIGTAILLDTSKQSIMSWNSSLDGDCDIYKDLTVIEDGTLLHTQLESFDNRIKETFNELSKALK